MRKIKIFITLLSCILSTTNSCCVLGVKPINSLQTNQENKFFVDNICFQLNPESKTAKVLGGSQNADRDGEIIIPASIEQDGIVYDVTEIADEAFAGENEIFKLTIEGHLRRIGNSAFDRTSFTLIDMHHGVDGFGEDTFLRMPCCAKFIVPVGYVDEYTNRIHQAGMNIVPTENSVLTSLG